MRRLLAVCAALALGGAILFAVAGGPATGGGPPFNILKEAAQGKLKPAEITTQTPSGATVTRTLPFVSDDTIVAAQEALGITNGDERLEGADAGPSGDITLDGQGGGGQTATGAGPAHSLGCGNRNAGPGDNQRVNQDCTYRRQAEEDITYNPADPGNLLAGQNDSRVGFNQCGIDFSTDNGHNWGDMLPPFRGHLNNPPSDGQNTISDQPGTLHTYDAASDPALAADSQGRAFFSCVIFDIADAASGIFVTESPIGAEGSFYYNVPELGNTFMPVEDNDPLVLHDKNMISADRYASSPNHDNVYLTWTVFKYGANCLGGSDTAPAYCESPIFGSMSTDHGHTWSKPQEISGSAPGLCFLGNLFSPTAGANDCDFDQGSYSVALPNGDLEVVFNNGNTAPGVPNGQQLGVHCHPTGDSTAGTASLNCGTPVKVGNDIVVGEPQCDFGRGPEECIPGAYIRTNDFPRITKDNTEGNHLYVVWQDYRNGEYDIQMSQSLDGGLTWHEVGTVNPDKGLDHYFAATDSSPQNNDRVGVSYYRTERVPNENNPANPFAFTPCPNPEGIPDACNAAFQPTGNSDYVLAGGFGGNTPYAFKVISPVFPPPDGIQTGFNGDYSGLTINRGDEAHPIWSDTRNVSPYPATGVTHDEDIFTDTVGLPNGNAHRDNNGQIGKGGDRR